ncbi:hypothetical protein J437_LFUL000003 [Ladona fulva]|uniref:Pyruvate dehydrogenase phosphatase regulatory subunit, mitochondrial n=1 Tax=Ladona fulva TaxID=123851 RepID=A0A8K0JZB3_LADFU|nr:hypothetical protein J437_LFUL000003 [Ladona fulva]
MGLISRFSNCSIGRSIALGLLTHRCHRGVRILSLPKFIHQSTAPAPASLPTEAQVVICGSGAVANSVAYHLVQAGWKDVIVLEQYTVGGGASQFGSGTLGLFKPSAERNLISYSIQLYKLLQENGYNIDLKQCGSLNLAQTKDRLIALKRRVSYSLPKGLHCEVLSPAEIRNLHPFLRTDGLEGGVWVPGDATADSSAVCMALAELARQGGVQYFEGCRVEWVLTENSKVKAVQTNLGIIDCQYFVNCAGMPMWDKAVYRLPILGEVGKPRLINWPENFTPDGRWILGETPEWARELGQRCSSKVRIPVNPAEHFYATTGPIPKLLSMSPPQNGYPTVRDYDAHIYVRDWIDPESKGVGLLVGNYFVGVGLNGNALQGAGGVGRAIAGWIISGEPPRGDLLPFDVRRFLDLHNNSHYLQQRTREVVGRHYSVLYPLQTEFKYARNLRCSPLYSDLETRGAVFGVRMGFERALYFDPTYTRGDPLPKLPPGTFGKPKFFDYMREEYIACREGVGIIDMSSFTKFEIKVGHDVYQSAGREVVSYLQHLCSNDVNIPVGGIAHTGMQNDRGGYENDCMLQTRILSWMRRHLPADNSVGLSDVTSMHTVLNVKVNVGYASDVMVMAFTNTGEPGYSLYIPSEYALHVYERLMKVGTDYGARDVGYFTLRFLRIEKFIPFWAEELDCVTTPYEVGRGYKVKLDKEEYFIGKYALQKQKETGVRRRLMLFALDEFDADNEVWPWGGEPIYRNGQFVGSVTSSGYGFTLDKMVCLGFVRNPAPDGSGPLPVTADYISAKGAKYEIDIAGKRILARPHLHPPLLYSTTSDTPARGNNEGALRYRPKAREAIVSAKKS